MKQKVYFKTFGCRTNIYDTEIMKNVIEDFEVVKDDNLADIIVVNSCTVTNGADAGVRGYINQAKRKGLKVIYFGCGASQKGKELFEKGSVFGVLGHSEKENINNHLKESLPFFQIGNLKSVDKTMVDNYGGKTKAFIKIQEGCDFRCSYCIIPYVRGNARSQDEKQIIEQISILAQNGYSEFVLTGTNIGSYGKDKGSTLGILLQKISKTRGLKRIRLGSIEPVQIDESFMENLDEPWLEKHLHIALQHTNEKMLKIMRRRNHALRDLELFLTLSQKGFSLGSDFITGHPGESEEIWNDALNNFKKYPLTHLHAFVYSKRDNTPSAYMSNVVPKTLAKERLKTLNDIVKKNNFVFREKNKVKLKVLVEEAKEGAYKGYDQFFNQLKIYSNKDILKKWVEVDNYLVKENENEARI